MPRRRILWLALADARGHLMRAQLVRRLMAGFDVDVDIVTTSVAGADFVAAFGAPAHVLSRTFRLVYDERQNLCRRRTDARTLGYLLAPGRCLRDLRWLGRRARVADLVVNDSFHPALVVAPLLHARLATRLVHVYGGNIRHAVEHHSGDWLAATIRRALRRSYACIEHGFDDSAGGDGAIRLPPIIAPPRRSPAEVRARLGVAPGQRLAVVYLNPHFRAPELAAAVERSLGGLAVHAVGEGYAGRRGWLARDPDLADAVAAADLYVSAPGMGALAHARTFGTPFLALVTNQPEQRRNVALLDGHPSRAVEARGDLTAPLAAAVADLLTARTAPADPAAAVAALQGRWARTLLDLIAGRRTA